MTDPKTLIKLSRFLSLVLRHNPQQIGLKLDANGWADTTELISKVNVRGNKLDLKTLELLVETNNKKRFAFNDDKSKIRANQGHSIKVELGYTAKTPPTVLYHGTANQNIKSIFTTGINKRERHHVHLSKDMETAISVGKRHGKPVVFEVDTKSMQKAGFEFYESDNGVWLVEEVPAIYLQKLEA